MPYSIYCCCYYYQRDDSLVPESPHILLPARSSNQQSNQPASDEFPAPTGVEAVELLPLPRVVVEVVEEEWTYFLHKSDDELI